MCFVVLHELGDCGILFFLCTELVMNATLFIVLRCSPTHAATHVPEVDMLQAAALHHAKCVSWPGLMGPSSA